MPYLRLDIDCTEHSNTSIIVINRIRHVCHNMSHFKQKIPNMKLLLRNPPPPFLSYFLPLTYNYTHAVLRSQRPQVTPFKINEQKKVRQAAADL
jgi:hypothetical protein